MPTLPLCRPLMIALLALPLASCDTAALWMAGIDPAEYAWVTLPGTKHDKSPQQDLDDCEAPSGHAAEAKSTLTAPTIARAENSPSVAACMADKGYRKSYQARPGLL